MIVRYDIKKNIEMLKHLEPSGHHDVSLTSMQTSSCHSELVSKSKSVCLSKNHCDVFANYKEI